MNMFLCVLAQKILEFVRDTPTGRELLADVYRMVRSWLLRAHAKTVVAQQKMASLGNTPEKPVLQVVYNIHNTQNCFKFNTTALVSSGLTQSAVLTVHGGFQYALNATVWVQYPTRWSETSGETQRLQVTIGHTVQTDSRTVDSTLALSGNTPEDLDEVHVTLLDVPDLLDLTMTLDFTHVAHASEACGETAFPGMPEK